MHLNTDLGVMSLKDNVFECSCLYMLSDIAYFIFESIPAKIHFLLYPVRPRRRLAPPFL